MKTTISVSSPSIHASIQPDMECGSGMKSRTSPVGSQTTGSPPIQVSHYTRMRKPDTPEFISTFFKGNNKHFLESPVMKGSLPNSGSSADESSHKTIPSPPGCFFIIEEPLGPALHPGGFVHG